MKRVTALVSKVTLIARPCSVRNDILTDLIISLRSWSHDSGKHIVCLPMTAVSIFILTIERCIIARYCSTVFSVATIFSMRLFGHMITELEVKNDGLRNMTTFFGIAKTSTIMFSTMKKLTAFPTWRPVWLDQKRLLGVRHQQIHGGILS